LSAAELEMMNLTGDGNGIDMITMPAAWRERVPTSNFFRPVGYARNPVAVRNNVVAKLIAVTNVRMDEECRLQGAKDMAAVFPKPSISAERRSGDADAVHYRTADVRTTDVVCPTTA